MSNQITVQCESSVTPEDPDDIPTAQLFYDWLRNDAIPPDAQIDAIYAGREGAQYRLRGLRATWTETRE